MKKLYQKNTLSKKHTQDYRRYFALNRNVAGFNLKTKELIYTLVCDKSDGAFVYDIDNNEYIDLKDNKQKNAKTAADKLRKITGITKEETTEAGTKIIGEKIRVEPVKGAVQPAKRDVSQSGKLKFSTKAS